MAINWGVLRTPHKLPEQNTDNHCATLNFIKSASVMDNLSSQKSMSMDSKMPWKFTWVPADNKLHQTTEKSVSTSKQLADQWNIGNRHRP